MQRYFCEEKFDNKFIINGDDYHHIKNVMRMKENDQVYICFNNETYLCKINNINDVIELEIINKVDEQRELPVEVTIAQGLPKGDKADLVVQKCTEFGASGFVFIESERTIVKYDNKKKDKKIERWSKIIKEASEQAHRQRIPIVNGIYKINNIKDIINDYDLLLFAYEELAIQGINTWDLLRSEFKNIKKVLLFIGPEGGISEEEADRLSKLGFKSISLGPRILRTEAAGLYFLSVTSYLLEQQ